MKIDAPIDPQLKHYIESSIIPQYNQLDSSHSPPVHQRDAYVSIIIFNNYLFA